MKKVLMIAVTLLALVAVTPAFGQINGLRVDIPFEFRAGGNVLPAGLYRIDIDPFAKRLEFRSVEGTAGAFLAAHMADGDAAIGHGVVVFHKYGNNYFLRRVTGPGQGSGYELPRTSAERELAKVYPGVQVASIRTK